MEATQKEKELVGELDKLPRSERCAFIAWFSGGRTRVVQYQSRKEAVSFGKTECELVSFEDFWLQRLPQLGWVTVEEKRRYTAKNMVGAPEAIEYLILPTRKGHDVREAFWSKVK
jgi:hypothetical protein